MGKAVGVDLGAESLRGVVVDVVKGKLELISAGSVPLGELGLMEDSEDKRLAIGEKLRALVKGAKLKAPIRRIGLPDKDADIRYLMVPPVPPWRLEMLAKYEVEEKSEDKEVRAFDYRILDIPESSGQFMVLIGCCNEKTTEWLLNSGRRASLGEVEIDLKPIALYNAYYHGHGFDPGKTALLVDIGADQTTVLLVKDGALYLARTLMGGGRRFTQVMADDMNMTPLEADDIKKRDAEIRFDLPPPTASRGTRIMRTGRTAIMRRDAEAAGGASGAPQPSHSRFGGPTRVIPKPNLDSLRLQTGDAASGQQPTSPNSSAGGTRDLSPSGGSKAGSAWGLKDDLAEKPEAGQGGGGGTLDASTAEPGGGSTGMTTVFQMPDGGDTEPEKEETPAQKRSRQMSASLVKEAAALCAALENMISYCKQQTKVRDLKVEKVYLTGAGSRLKGLSTFIGRRMRVEAEPLKVFNNISLERMPPAAAAALKEEEDTMAVAVGLAVSNLCRGAFSFLLWPSELKQKKEFRARGAFLYYAAAMFLAVLGLAWLTPKHNKDVFAETHKKADEAIVQAKTLDGELEDLAEQYEELALQMEQMEKNAGSGHFLLKILAELKNYQKIPKDIFLVQLSTSMPRVVLTETGRGDGDGSSAEPVVSDEGTMAYEAKKGFTAETVVYFRGFSRGPAGHELLEKVKGTYDENEILRNTGFCDLLVPKPDFPDDPANLFKDIRPIWYDTDQIKEGPFTYQEFVVQAFLEGNRDEKSKDQKEKDKKKTETAEKQKSDPGKPLPTPSVPKPRADVPEARGSDTNNTRSEPAVGLTPNPAPTKGSTTPATPESQKPIEKSEFVLPGSMPTEKK